MGLAAFNRRRRELAQQGAERGASERAPSATLKGMTVAELRVLATERGIDLGDATRKADIIAALEAAGEH